MELESFAAVSGCLHIFPGLKAQNNLAQRNALGNEGAGVKRPERAV